MTSVPIPERGGTAAEIRNAQQEVLKILERLKTLILNPDSVSTQLKPRFKALESLYTEALLSGLIRLDSVQGGLEELCVAAGKSAAIQAFDDLSEVPEARRNADVCRKVLATARSRLRKEPEDRDRAAKKLAPEAKVKDLAGEDVTLRRLKKDWMPVRKPRTRLPRFPARLSANSRCF
jgi:hypothetical protein